MMEQFTKLLEQLAKGGDMSTIAKRKPNGAAPTMPMPSQQAWKDVVDGAKQQKEYLHTNPPDGYRLGTNDAPTPGRGDRPVLVNRAAGEPSLGNRTADR